MLDVRRSYSFFRREVLWILDWKRAVPSGNANIEHPTLNFQRRTEEKRLIGAAGYATMMGALHMIHGPGPPMPQLPFLRAFRWQVPGILNMQVDGYQTALMSENQIAGVGISDDHAIGIPPPVLVAPEWPPGVRTTH